MIKYVQNHVLKRFPFHPLLHWVSLLSKYVISSEHALVQCTQQLQNLKTVHPNPFLTFRSKPLQIWDKSVRNGHIKRITDPDIQSSVLEIMGTNVSTNYINAPLDPKKTLAIKLPFLVMIIKNLKKYFTFEV